MKLTFSIPNRHLSREVGRFANMTLSVIDADRGPVVARVLPWGESSETTVTRPIYFI